MSKACAFFFKIELCTTFIYFYVHSGLCVGAISMVSSLCGQIDNYLLEKKEIYFIVIKEKNKDFFLLIEISYNLKFDGLHNKGQCFPLNQ